ncbi:dihydroorotate dehydrogenase (NAD+) catalytic subunit [Arcanobacterium pluranimalium]|uniref:dihydroorotate dehydrogenase n=1 Tax=Arcanobacterium pluranimalium TaxID=108028 RepID=UPI00195A25C3|nr:dihydroorotate dehydrogenase [Arcanobacterium pluranimalium]MBM7824248.1 dihydroorotate dehydrogenase (NAD+) catalytic subunit [Arcanobacterium pluranimalium]
MEQRLRVNLCGIDLVNPIIPASGTFGFGYEFSQLYDLNILGSFAFKGTTGQARFGNPTPRVAECEAGMLNAIGLQNPGVAEVKRVELPRIKEFFAKPVMANISGFTVEEYQHVASELDEEANIGWLELNISCPNVHGGGVNFGSYPDSAAQVTAAVREVTGKPLVVKLSPNVTDVVAVARACVEAGANALSVINTLIGMRFDLKTRAPILANQVGGFSGAAIFPLALRMVHQVSNAVNVPVIGIGGVHSAEQVIEMMIAGATAVQVGTANLVDPFACPRIISELPAVMDRLGIDTLEQLIGEIAQKRNGE